MRGERCFRSANGRTHRLPLASSARLIEGCLLSPSTTSAIRDVCPTAPSGPHRPHTQNPRPPSRPTFHLSSTAPFRPYLYLFHGG
ncbi:hypothetical protein BV20DRAFT_961442 [Pilatotrama ljubarskyi]|nr:hypothetical protein BV20DRAFT_961442 [Pilatotrama ljubarskyi]